MCMHSGSLKPDCKQYAVCFAKFSCKGMLDFLGNFRNFPS